MKTIKNIRPSRTLVVFFLLASIVCSSVTAFAAIPKAKELVFTKKTKAHSKSVAQFPYEEKEKEEEKGLDRTQDHFSFLSLVDEATLFSFVESHNHSFLHAPHPCELIAQVPLYLVKRSLLI
ncbi:hypothetical protein [Ohtaekwangia koreensis]|uniref:Uncharacterized protein n=1 Tax=Ohtaekwangia koreensis TaxID=688867 RepID=A0A1T5J0W6_9BACT|nr:hypothetical protein [Ohtaekwangia koreensis]SKC45115.1 hypothetical protein SAMN05660236_0635 [Ohtaekwangia koreensis]